jgi:hypothetical protein
MFWHGRIQEEHMDFVREITKFIIGEGGSEWQVWSLPGGMEGP